LRAAHSHKRGNITTRERQIEFSAFTLMGRERKQAERMAGKWPQAARVCAGVFAAASNIHQHAVAHSETNQYTNLFHAEHFAGEFVCELEVEAHNALAAFVVEALNK
jgi:hypothetical protein